MDRYVLNEQGDPVLEPDLLKWADFIEAGEKRRIELTQVGDLEVSTVFLGIDHNFGGVGPPILWETMIFAREGKGRLDQMQWRYRSKEAALHGHKQAVTLCMEEVLYGGEETNEEQAE